MPTTCSHPPCKKPAIAKGLCRFCYERTRNGKPLSDPKYWNRRTAKAVAAFERQRKYEGVQCSNCDRPAKVKGLCPRCYQRQSKGIPLDRPFLHTNKGKTCEIEGCGNPARVKGVCKPCYYRELYTKGQHGAANSQSLQSP